jgi:hypothetical protein
MIEFTELQLQDYANSVNGLYKGSVHFIADDICGELVVTIDVQYDGKSIIDGDNPSLNMRQIKLLCSYLNSLLDSDKPQQP